MARAVVEIPLTQGFVTIIDPADYHLVGQFRWCADVNGRTVYAKRRGRRSEGGGKKKLHSFLTGWPHVDHINGDGLDNRRVNLRRSTHQQNSANQRLPKNNTSGFKGVSWRKDNGRWSAHIGYDRTLHHLGLFTVVEDAARAYDAAALAVWGEYASLNFPLAGQRSALPVPKGVAP